MDLPRASCLNIRFPFLKHSPEASTIDRRDTGLATHWDSHLSFLLGGALYSYEAERVTGVASGAVEFQHRYRPPRTFLTIQLFWTRSKTCRPGEPLDGKRMVEKLCTKCVASTRQKDAQKDPRLWNPFEAKEAQQTMKEQLTPREAFKEATDPFLGVSCFLGRGVSCFNDEEAQLTDPKKQLTPRPAPCDRSIRRAVPDGFTFKGFPIHFAHLSAPRMLRDLLRSKVASEIIGLQGGAQQVGAAVGFTDPERMVSTLSIVNLCVAYTLSPQVVDQCRAFCMALRARSDFVLPCTRTSCLGFEAGTCFDSCLGLRVLGSGACGARLAAHLSP